jgi:GAF domain-containing protein/signal transduction histidine kinase
MNDYLYLFVGLLVGLLLSGLVWWFWGRFRASTGYSTSLDENRDDEELKSRLDELTILHAIATAGAEASDEDNLVERVTRVIGENLYPNNFGVLLREENGDRLRTHPSYREEGKLRVPEWVPIGEGICGQVALLGESRYVPDVTKEQNYIEVDPATRSELCVPLKVRERVIGVLNAEREELDGFTASDERMLSIIAGQLATAIDRLRAESGVHRRAGQLSILSSISQEVVASLIPEQVFAAIHRAAAQLMYVDVFLIALRDEGENLAPAYFRDRNGPVSKYSLPASMVISAHVFTNSEPVLINNRRELKGLGISPGEDENVLQSVLAVPLILGGRVFGVLSCHSPRVQDYSQDDLETLNTLANQAAIAIENARLFEETQQQLAELTFLSQIIAITATENDLTIALSLICEELAHYLNVPEVSFALLNSQLSLAQVIAAYHDEDRPEVLGKQIPIIGNPVMTSVLESGSPLAIEDTNDSLLLSNFDMERDAASLLLAPIIFGGEVVGTLEVVSLSRRHFTPSEISLVQKVSSQVGQVLERLGLFAATRDQAERMAHLAMISEGLNRPLSLDEVINSIGNGAVLLSEANRAALYLRHEGGRVSAPWFENLSPEYIHQVSQRFEELPGGTLFSSSDPILVSDINQLPADSLLKVLGSEEGFHGIEIWPLVYKDKVVAAIGCYFDAPHIGSETEQEVMLTFARQAAVALVNAQLFDETRRRTLQLEALNAIITEVAAAADLDHLLGITLEHTLRALGLHIGGIWVGDQRVCREMSDELRGVFEQLIADEDPSTSMTIAVPDWEDLQEGHQYANLSETLLDFDTRSSLTVALHSEGNQVGGLCVASPKERVWLPEEIALVEGVGRQLDGAIERIALLERIQENALQVQYIIDTVPEGVILLDEENRVVLANPVAQSYLVDLAEFSPDETLTHLGEKPLAELIDDKHQNIWFEIEKTGPPRQIFEISPQQLEKDENPGGWVIVIREVTHERETQTRIQMQERLATVGQLAAGIAHDFNNILAAIVVYADLLKRDPNLLSASQERLSIIQQQVHRAASLIRQILDFSRRSVMEQSMLDLLPFVKELDKLLRRVLPETIQIELNYQPGVYLVNADPTRLQQVFMNLAVNARDASADGGVLEFDLDQVQILDEESPPCPDIPKGVWNRITVKDSGEGIPADVLPHIFEPFFTTKPVGEGTGLGLAQAYGIIKQHDGYIDAHSELGKGTIFHIYLPAQQPIYDQADHLQSPAQTKGSGETLLLVEDDFSTREAMKTLLEDLGYQVLVASNGQEALDIYELKANQIDLVVSDMVMPVMGGVTLFKNLNARWPQVKMLFITGHPEKEGDRALLESGNVNWLQKPFSVGDFNEAIYNLLHE